MGPSKDTRHLQGVIKAFSMPPAAPSQNIKALNENANRLREQGQFQRARQGFEKVLKKDPSNCYALNGLGNVAWGERQYLKAIGYYQRVLEIEPGYLDARNNLASNLTALGRYDEAETQFRFIIERLPEHAPARNNLGNLLKQLNRLEEAVEFYREAIRIKPDYAEAHNNLAVVLKQLGRKDEAVASYQKAITYKPNYPAAHKNLGNIFRESLRFEEAVHYYRRALELKPDYEFLFGDLVHARLNIIDWQDIEEDLSALQKQVKRGQSVSSPFPLVGFGFDPADQLRANKVYSSVQFLAGSGLGQTFVRKATEKVVIAYYTADFHNHATAHLMVRFFELHDRDRFELIGFSFGNAPADEMTQRLKRAFDQFYDVRAKSDRDIAQFSRQLGVDIAVDLKGYTQNCRPGIFMERCAPIQVNYLGFPGTMGAPFMDYLVADRVIIPPEMQQHYTEKVLYMPHSYQVNDDTRVISNRVFTRQEVGLPEKAFVFCCFNNNYKILPEVFDVWMTLLKQVPGSVLWLLQDNALAASNLRKEASARGVDPSRLVFAERMPVSEHLARQRLADLFIDTWPCNAHTTASDALWAGLPVLTLMGETFAGRVAASLLTAIHLPELIATSPEEYLTKALQLANDAIYLNFLKDCVRIQRTRSSLFNPGQAANDFANLMWQLAKDGPSG